MLTVGVAYCDATSRRLGACEFADDEHFCTLEAVIVQLGAKEVVLPKVCPSSHVHTIVTRVVSLAQWPLSSLKLITACKYFNLRIEKLQISQKP